MLKHIELVAHRKYSAHGQLRHAHANWLLRKAATVDWRTVGHPPHMSIAVVKVVSRCRAVGAGDAYCVGLLWSGTLEMHQKDTRRMLEANSWLGIST